MWLLNVTTLKLESYDGDSVPEYAILSHRWESGEVSFKDVQKDRQKHMPGWLKIEKCCHQALKDGLFYVWADTCCIDKRSSAELTEAINSMYLWYKEAAVCYAYLSDVRYAPRDGLGESTEDQFMKTGGSNDDGVRCTSKHFHTTFTESLWFTRGWTLQELLAPAKLIFYDCIWTAIGSKCDLRYEIHRRTGIREHALENFSPYPGYYSVAEKMVWAAGRNTTRPEDRAYSLLGIFDVNMPMLYGERQKAFQRLQEEIMKRTNDTTIFIWSPALPSRSVGLLAESTEEFMHDDFLTDGPPEPHQRSLSVDNSWVSGRFVIQRYVFDIFAAAIGEQHYKYGASMWICLFLQWHPYEQSFHRVTLDDRSLVMFQSNDSFRSPSTMQIIRIRKDGLDHRRLNSASFASYLQGHTLNSFSAALEVTVRPGVHRARSGPTVLLDSNLNGGNHCNGLWVKEYSLDQPDLCLCFSRRSSRWKIHGKDLWHRAVIYFGLNIEQRPAVYLRELPGSDEPSLDIYHDTSVPSCVNIGYVCTTDSNTGRRRSCQNVSAGQASSAHSTDCTLDLTEAELRRQSARIFGFEDILTVYIISLDEGDRAFLQFEEHIDGIETIPESWLVKSTHQRVERSIEKEKLSSTKLKSEAKNSKQSKSKDKRSQHGKRQSAPAVSNAIKPSGRSK